MKHKLTFDQVRASSAQKHSERFRRPITFLSGRLSVI